MELKKFQKLLNDTDAHFPHTGVVFKYGEVLLEPNNVTEVSKDSRMLTVHLRALTKGDTAGVIPDWKIDKSSKKSQMLAIKEWLEAGHKITPLDALEMFGCFRLSAQIFNLKKLGLHIDCKVDVDPQTGKRYGTYWLTDSADKPADTH